MKISNVRIREEGDSVFLTAQCQIRYVGTDEVYFKFDKRYREALSADASAFAAALLIPSMKLHQDLVIEGSISEKLQQGMYRIMQTMVGWDLGYQPIRIIADRVTPDDFVPSKNASFFSGGVDSFYTYLHHQEEEGKKIDCFVLANGFDISLDNPRLWDLACRTVDDVARSEGVEVIKVESNIRTLIEPVEIWDFTHGGCLVALGLALRRELRDVYIPSSLALGQLLPWGSHPELDPQWSTETLHFHHDGAETLRVNKVKFMAHNPLVLKNLRVCYLNEKDKFNCGVCDKCLRTMINLRVAGALHKSETFPQQLDREVIAKLKVVGEHGAILHKENLKELEELGIEPELQQALRESIERFEHPRFDAKEELAKLKFYFHEAINQIRQLDFFYNQDRLYRLKNRVVRKLRGKAEEKNVWKHAENLPETQPLKK